jgi:hypothetical protein
MSATAGEMPIELEAAAQAVAGPELEPPVPADDSFRRGGENPEPADAPAEQADARVLPEIERAIGATRQAVLDHFRDTEGDQSMSQIKAALPNVLPGTVEACVRREWEAGRLLRVSPGTYRLAPKPPEPPKRPSTPPPPTPDEEAMWFDALEAWAVDPSSWNVEELGPPPDVPNNNIPPDIRMRFTDRLRKREEGRRDREAAIAKQAAADRELRDKLIGAAGNNIVRSSALDEVAPIRAAMELVPLNGILTSIRDGLHRLMCPASEPARSWRETRLLTRIAEDYCRRLIVPNLVDVWSKAGQAPAAKTQSSPPSVAPSTVPDVPMPPPANAADTSEAQAAVSAPATEETAPASPQPQAAAIPDAAIGEEPAAVDAEMPEAPTRASILAAFARDRTPPQPAASPRPAPPQPTPPPRPQRQAAPAEREEIGEAAYDEIVAGWKAGNLAWARKWGPAPGEVGCRVPLAVLKRNRLA